MSNFNVANLGSERRYSEGIIQVSDWWLVFNVDTYPLLALNILEAL